MNVLDQIQGVDFNRVAFLKTQHWTLPNQLFSAALDSPWYRTISHIMSVIQSSTFKFYDSYNFISVPLPITCHSISSPFGLGSDSEPVKVELFGKPTYLADSMQFHLEYLIRQGFKGVYYIMPTFRGEDPDERHLNQFFHSEMEMEGTLDDVMKVIEGYINFCVKDIYGKCGGMIESLGGGVEHIEKFLASETEIPKISFSEAVKLLPQQSSLYKSINGKIMNLSNEGEKYLMDYFQGPVWVMYYPVEAVPFYQAWKTDKYAYCADLLMGIGEVVGCGQRHGTFEETYKALLHHGVQPQEYEWYLRMKKDYPLQTSGFGMGIERLILWLLNHDDIRDISMFNRIKGFESSP